MRISRGWKAANERVGKVTTNGFALATTIILLLPMLYFLLASPTFLLRPLSDPVVTWLLRGLYSVHFRLVAITCALAAMAFVLAGKPLIATGIGLVAALAMGARRWFLGRLDAELQARDGGDGVALRRLRRLHWGGMALNAAQFIAILASIPAVFPEAG